MGQTQANENVFERLRQHYQSQNKKNDALFAYMLRYQRRSGLLVSRKLKTLCSSTGISGKTKVEI